jgi:hypothetical protein
LSSKDSPGKVVALREASAKADKRRDARREAKASSLKQRFSSARKGAESKSRAAERLKKLFKQPDS